MGNIHEDSATDENGYDWDHGSAWRDLLDYKPQMNTAEALRIAMEVMSGNPHHNTPEQIAAARGMISAIRAQEGVFGPDAEALGEGEHGLMATRQIDIWVFG